MRRMIASALIHNCRRDVVAEIMKMAATYDASHSEIVLGNGIQIWGVHYTPHAKVRTDGPNWGEASGYTFLDLVSMLPEEIRNGT